MQISSPVIVPEGASGTSFPIGTSPVSGNHTVTVAFADATVNLSGSLTVLPPKVTRVSVTPASIVSGQSATGTVTLGSSAPDGGLIVSLSSSQSFAHVPSTVTVPGGSKSAGFTVKASTVTMTSAATIAASYGGSSAQAGISVLQNPSVTSLTLGSNDLVGTFSTKGTVTLNTLAPAGGTVVNLSSSLDGVHVPATVTVAHGSSTATFPVTTQQVTTVSSAKISGKAAGSAASSTLVVEPWPVEQIDASGTVASGQTIQEIVRLSERAPVGGVLVHVSSDKSYLTVTTPTVTVPEGYLTAPFTLQASVVGVRKAATLSASAGGTPATGQLYVAPPPVTKLSIQSTSIYGGHSTQGTATISLAAGSGGVEVDLGSSSAAAQAPSQLVVPQGQTSISFTVTTTRSGDIATSKISAGNDGKVGAQQTLTIYPNGLAQSAWPKFRGNAYNSGFSSIAGSNNGIEKWSYDLGGNTWSSPALAPDGTIYIGNTSGDLVAIDPAGTKKWAFHTDGLVMSSPAVGSDGTIYVGSEDGKFYAITPDGNERWSFTTGDQIQSSPAIAADGTIYIGSYDGNLYALDGNGSELWHFSAPGIFASPAVGDDGTIYLGAGGGQDLFAINPNGTQKWVFNGDGYNFQTPTISHDGTIYITADDGYLYAISSDGALKSSFQMASSYWGYVVSSPSIGPDGAIYAGTLFGRLYAIKPNGTELWHFSVDGLVQCSPVIGPDGAIYFAGLDDDAFALRPDGSTQWEFVMDGDNSSPAIAADGTLYLSGNDGKLHAIGTAGTVPPPPKRVP
ncbi:MAG TPA: PQQ-binding-like beta-propeller repeat protein [Fimbriimonas sp.]|nr:PQQ-binding-like beta-propeller repeat protein [Fimbriimonas sp.]